VTRRNGGMVFITGTDTGVGKTVFTLCLLRYLRKIGLRVIGLKPFCSGDRQDAERIRSESVDPPSLEIINPYFCRSSVAPGVLKNPGYRAPHITEIQRAIESAAKGYDFAIIEGIGGILAPITPSLMVADLIESMRCPAVVVGRDALGTLNHTSLTLIELLRRNIRIDQVILMKNIPSDASTKSNRSFLSQQFPLQSFATFPKLSEWPDIQPKNASDRIIFKKTLARFQLLDTFCIRRYGPPNRKRKGKSKAAQPSGLLKLSKAR
jgi:dethiobiotin synthetase